MPIGKISVYPQARISINADLQELPEADQHVEQRKMPVSIETSNHQYKPMELQNQSHVISHQGQGKAEITIERGDGGGAVIEVERRRPLSVRSESSDSAKSGVKPGRLSYTAAALEERIFQEIKEHEVREKELKFIRHLSSTSSQKDSTHSSGTVTPAIAATGHDLGAITVTTTKTTVVTSDARKPTVELTTSKKVEGSNVTDVQAAHTKTIEIEKTNSKNKVEINVDQNKPDKVNVNKTDMHVVTKETSNKDEKSKEITVEISTKEIKSNHPKQEIPVEKSTVIAVDKPTKEISVEKSKNIAVDKPTREISIEKSTVIAVDKTTREISVEKSKNVAVDKPAKQISFEKSTIISVDKPAREISVEKSTVIAVDKPAKEISVERSMETNMKKNDKHSIEKSVEITIVKNSVDDNDDDDDDDDDDDGKNGIKDRMIENVKNKVQPLEDYESIQEDKAVFKPLRESTINLEVRVAREREQDLMVSRGQRNGGGWKSQKSEESIVIVTPVILKPSSEGGVHVSLSHDDEAFKKSSENRFKAELQREKEKELGLLKEGKIKSLSTVESSHVTTDQKVNIKYELENELAQLKELNKTKKIKIEVENIANHPPTLTKHFLLKKEVEEVNNREQELRKLKETLNQNNSITVTTSKTSTSHAHLPVEATIVNDNKKEGKADHNQASVVIVTKEGEHNSKAAVVIVTDQTANSKSTNLSSDKSKIKTNEAAVAVRKNDDNVTVAVHKEEKFNVSDNKDANKVEITKRISIENSNKTVEIIQTSNSKPNNNIPTSNSTKTTEVDLKVNDRSLNNSASIEITKTGHGGDVNITTSEGGSADLAPRRKIGKLSIIEKWEQVNRDGPPVLHIPE